MISELGDGFQGHAPSALDGSLIVLVEQDGHLTAKATAVVGPLYVAIVLYVAIAPGAVI